MPSIVDGTQLLEQLRAECLRARHADLAVAFWGEGAVENLGLQEAAEVRIVCNLMSGGTNPNEIRALRKKGADVRQLSDLHAKIGVVGDMSFVGSSNMSANGLGAEGAAARWREANVVYDKAHPEIKKMFESYWNAAAKISEADLEAAMVIWADRWRANAVRAARRNGRRLVDVLRTEPDVLDALNVRMVVYDTVTDADELAVLEDADKHARYQYGQAFSVYWDWDSMTTDAAIAYLVDYDWPARGVIARGNLYRRNANDFPDFEQEEKTFHVAYEIDDIEGITFGASDKAAIRRAFHAYVHDGAVGEDDDQRAYNFPISELARYLPPND